MPIRSAAGAVSGLGFVDYNDTGGDVSVQADTWTTVTNDGAGAFTNKGFTVSGVTEVMDSVGRLDFQYLSLGDGLLVRTDVTVTPSVNGLSMEVRWNLGTTSPYSLSTSLGSLVSGAGISTQVVFLNYIYIGDTNTANGLGELQFRSSEDCTLNNAGSAIQILKREV